MYPPSLVVHTGKYPHPDNRRQQSRADPAASDPRAVGEPGLGSLHNWRRQLAAVGSRKRLRGEAPMAIKRSSKSLGSPVRKPVASAALRHVDVIAPRQMLSGELYLGWVCKSKPTTNLPSSSARIAGTRICIAGALGVSTSTQREALARDARGAGAASLDRSRAAGNQSDRVRPPRDGRSYQSISSIADACGAQEGR
jgi:hypothetical protein